jgi:hypothetical protein
MDLQTLVNIFGAAGLAASGWFARVLWEANRDLRSDLSNLREEIPKRYVAKEDYRVDLREIKDLLTAIRDMLDRKADK